MKEIKFYKTAKKTAESNGFYLYKNQDGKNLLFDFSKLNLIPCKDEEKQIFMDTLKNEIEKDFRFISINDLSWVYYDIDNFINYDLQIMWGYTNIYNKVGKKLYTIIEPRMYNAIIRERKNVYEEYKNIFSYGINFHEMKHCDIEI